MFDKTIEHSDTMTYREDITEYLKSEYGLKGKNYKVHQYNKFIYLPNYDGGELVSFGHFRVGSLYGLSLDMIKDVTDKFNVLAVSTEEKPQIVCRCGERTKFSANYHDYSLELTCGKCGNMFTAYSG